VQVYRDWSEVPKRARAITIGVFDGVHQGHRTLLRQLLSAARERNLGALVVTFANHPQSVLNPPAPPLVNVPRRAPAIVGGNWGARDPPPCLYT